MLYNFHKNDSPTMPMSLPYFFNFLHTWFSLPLVFFSSSSFMFVCHLLYEFATSFHCTHTYLPEAIMVYCIIYKLVSWFYYFLMLYSARLSPMTNINMVLIQYFSSPDGLLKQALNRDKNICSNSGIKGINSWIAFFYIIMTSSWCAIVLPIVSIMDINNIGKYIMGLDVPTFNKLTSTLQKWWRFKTVHPSKCDAYVIFYRFL